MDLQSLADVNMRSGISGEVQSQSESESAVLNEILTHDLSILLLCLAISRISKSPVLSDRSHVTSVKACESFDRSFPLKLRH